MMLRACLIFTVAAMALSAGAQSFEEYLKLRKKAGITLAVGIPALETFVGKRTMEVKGVVKGTISMGGGHTILLERTDGENIYVQADSLPDWLVGNEVPARLLIKAERESENADLKARLIAASNEAEVAQYEAREAAKYAKPVRVPVAPAKKPANVSAKDWNMAPSQALLEYARFIKGQNKRLSDQEAYNIASGVIGYSVMYGVDARLIMAMVMAESNFNPNATSSVGAMGLGQLMPGTAKGLGVTNAYDTTQNLYGTVRMIKGHLERYGKQTGNNFDTLVLSLAAYNAGSGAVRRHGGVPPYRETQNYIRKVVSYYRAFIGDKP